MYKFFVLSSTQLDRFEQFKTSRELANHGPLNAGESVPLHSHGEYALYLVRGAADFIGQGFRRMLGCEATANAVLVAPGAEHGWFSARPGTQIEHVFGEELAQSVLA